MNHKFANLVIWIAIGVGTWQAIEYYNATKTNRDHFMELVQVRDFEKISGQMLDQAKVKGYVPPVAPSDAAAARQEFINCMVREANNYLASQDPSLNQQANSNTNQLLLQRFFTSCRTFYRPPQPQAGAPPKKKLCTTSVVNGRNYITCQ